MKDKIKDIIISIILFIFWLIFIYWRILQEYDFYKNLFK